MHVKTYPAFLTPIDKKLSLSSSVEKSSEFGWLENEKKWKMKEKEKQSKALYILYIDRLHIWLHASPSIPLLVFTREFI